MACEPRSTTRSVQGPLGRAGKVPLPRPQRDRALASEVEDLDLAAEHLSQGPIAAIHDLPLGAPDGRRAPPPARAVIAASAAAQPPDRVRARHGRRAGARTPPAAAEVAALQSQ